MDDLRLLHCLEQLDECRVLCVDLKSSMRFDVVLQGFTTGRRVEIFHNNGVQA